MDTKSASVALGAISELTWVGLGAVEVVFTFYEIRVTYRLAFTLCINMRLCRWLVVVCIAMFVPAGNRAFG